MANAREISQRMKSIQDTMKITNAMYTISSSKLKKAKKCLADTEPYFYALQSTISRIIRHVPDFENKYFDERVNIAPKDRKIGYVVITADKGLAGAYNHNVIKLAQQHLNSHPNNKLFVLGELGRQYFAKRGVDIDGDFRYTVQNPTMHRARDIAGELIDQYLSGELDEIYVVYTKMVSAMKMEAEFMQLLPFKKANYIVNIPAGTIMEEMALVPSANDVMNRVVPNAVTGLLYCTLVESYSSEHNARMTAMDAATKSAKDMLRELGIIYNRVRQAAITQEITEVIGGAKAQKSKKKR